MIFFIDVVLIVTYLVSVGVNLIVGEFFEFSIHLHAFEHRVRKRFDVVREKGRRPLAPALSRFPFPGPKTARDHRREIILIFSWLKHPYLLYRYSSFSSDPPIPEFWCVNSPRVQIFFSWLSGCLTDSISRGVTFAPAFCACTFNRVSLGSWVDPFLTIK